MSNVAVIYAANLKPLASQPVFGGASALERSLQWTRTIPEYQGMILLTDSSTDKVFPQAAEIANLLFTIKKDIWTEESLVNALTEVADRCKESLDTIVFAWGDCPLLDVKTTETLWQLHRKYHAEYTFADGYPVGLVPEFLAARLPGKLQSLAAGRNGMAARNSLFEIIRQNINAYDVETHLSPRDMRMERVSITCDTRRNKNIAEALYNAGGTDADSLCRIIPENLKLLRDVPAYFPIQISNRCPQACSYCPFPTFSGNPLEGSSFMEVDHFANLCRRIVDFAGDAVITPSLWGEPAAHPQISEIIYAAFAAAKNEDNVRVLIETSGIGWNRHLLTELAKNTPIDKLTWIVSLDAADGQLYNRLRGPGMPEAEETAGILAELFGKNCYVQAVRMHDNEEDLDSFYNRWKDIGGGPIIQKHNSFSGSLANLQPAELSPLNRFPCWHLKRDMCILLDGTVPLCHCDIENSCSLGNVFKEDLAAIWARGESIHQNHIDGKYHGPCTDCDEYYTFNY